MSEPVPYHKALQMAQAHNELLEAIINEQRKLSEIKTMERLILIRDEETWELDVEDAMPDGDGVRLMGRAKRVS